jgi:hypothetical protein
MTTNEPDDKVRLAAGFALTNLHHVRDLPQDLDTHCKTR